MISSREYLDAYEEGRPVLLTGGAVVTVDDAVDDLLTGDVLLDGGHIVAVGADLSADPRYASSAGAALRIDTRGAVVTPGFVDSHRHAWETQLRRSIPDVDDLGEYVRSTLLEVAPLYTPDDMYVGTRLAALSALDAGITTMLDFSHNSRSAAHSNAAVDALADSGIRGVHASMAPHFGDWDRQWPADVERLMTYADTAGPGRVSVRLAALATDEIAGPVVAYGRELAAIAHDLGIWTSIDAVFGEASSQAILRWEQEGILRPDLTIIHATGLSSRAWSALGDAQATVSLAPTSDAQIGLESAVPALDEAMSVGLRPGLSIDVEVALPSDMFTQMRTLLAIQRMRAVNQAYTAGAPTGTRLTTRDVLEFATLRGAEANGLGASTGSITPGKSADLLIVRADDVNNMPLNDPVGTLVLGADPRNIEVVLVGGRPKKWDRALLDVDVDALRSATVRSRDAILTRR